jgi:hypothetical protein
MKLRSSFEDWDFLKTWSIEDGKSYPMLRWQEGAPQSGFEAEAIEGWVVPDISFWLTISEAMDEDGKPLYGSHQVTIYIAIWMIVGHRLMQNLATAKPKCRSF